ncbi:MAG: hypothetical protein M0C28_32015 [Candidatus Moduliflexus flocculans]|nr:hypothetical protein [Candidatus Moduliflexus flocculans]
MDSLSRSAESHDPHGGRRKIVSVTVCECDEYGKDDGRRTVLIIVNDRNGKFPIEAVFDFKAFGSGDVLER